MDIFKKSLPLLWKPQEKIKFWFIQEPWIYFLVKSRNSQIFYITNIMTFSKFAQEIYFYLLVASLYLIRSKLKIFIHSFILCRLPCPNEWFQFKLFWRKCNEKVASSNLIISFRNSSPMLKSCWIHSKINNLLSYCSAWLNRLLSETYKTVQNPEPAICRCSAR